MNKIFSSLVAFCLGMVILLPTFSYIKKVNVEYNYPPTTMLYPKHPVIECAINPECAKLAEAAYYESRSETNLGVLAVMKTILNRKAHPKWENTIEGVVEAPRQFSYTHDGSMERAEQNTEQWARMYLLAHELISGRILIPYEWNRITHYLTISTNTPWSRKFEQVVVIGNHKFFNCKKEC